MLHSLKPLGYVRYGDDFVLWCGSELEAKKVQVVGTQFLQDYLHLQTNKKHDVVQPTTKRLTYLGVELWPSGRRLKTTTKKRIERKLNLDNMASYDALIDHHQSTRYKKHILQQKLDIYDNI